MDRARTQRKHLDATLVAISCLELEVGHDQANSTSTILRLNELERAASQYAATAGIAGRAVERANRAEQLGIRSGAAFDLDGAIASLHLDDNLAALAAEHARFALESLDKVLGLAGPAGADGWSDPRTPPADAAVRAFRALDACMMRLANELGNENKDRLLSMWAAFRFPELRLSESVSAETATIVREQAARLTQLWISIETGTLAGSPMRKPVADLAAEVAASARLVAATMSKE